jgi:hypothetical protein
MAFLEHAINLEDLPESTSDGEFKPLPAGWYSAIINTAELKPTKDGTGQKLSLRFDVTGPTHQGRVIWGNLNIKNNSVKAEEIGRAQLGVIMRALGLNQVTDTDQLINGALQIKLEVVEATEQYKAKNEIKAYKAAEGSMPAGAVPTFAKPVVAKSAGAAPPWAKK